jgi:hypothetical protein
VAQLDEVVREGFRHGALEEISLAAFLARSSVAHNLALGTEWSLPGLVAETDVAGASDGWLVLGEAKSGSKFDDATQPEKLVSLAVRLEARALVFATREVSWMPAALSRIQEVAANAHGVEIRTYQDLLNPAGPKQI